MEIEIRTEECMVLEIDGHRTVMTREQVRLLYKHLANWLGYDPEAGSTPEPDKDSGEDSMEIERLKAQRDHLLRSLDDLRRELWRYSPASPRLPFPCPRPEQLNPIVTCAKIGEHMKFLREVQESVERQDRMRQRKEWAIRELQEQIEHHLQKVKERKLP